MSSPAQHRQPSSAQFRLLRSAFAGLLGVIFLASAQAVQVVGGDVNTSDPGNSFNGQTFSLALPWNNVGRVNGSSAVYLGDINANGTFWVLTAYHVAGGLPTTADFGGTNYSTVSGTYVRLNNGADLGNSPTDLAMFRLDLNSNPSDLGTLSLLSTPLTVGDDLYYVGYGGGTKRWGFNDYEGDAAIQTSPTSYGIVRTIWSDYDSDSSNPNEAQAISGDSGGAAFYYDSGAATWNLAGIMDAVDTSRSPATTYSASVAYYRPQIVAAAVPEASVAILLTSGLALVGAARRRR